jgi:hypothetical protein
MIALGAACWAAGDIILKAFLGKNVALPPLTRPSLAFATGNVALSYLLTGLGFIGGFVPAVLWAVFLGGIGITIWHIVGESKEYIRSWSVNPVRNSCGASNSAGIILGPNPAAEQRNPISNGVNQTIQEQAGKKRERVLYFLIMIIGLFTIPAILQAAAPPYVRDSLVYHLLCPKEYLKVGHLVHIEGNIFSAFPKGHEVLMTLLLSISGDRAAQGFSILQQIAAIGELYSLTYLMAGFLPAAICVIGYATVPPVMYFTGCGYVEPALLMTLGGSLLVLFLSSRSPRGRAVAEGIGLKPILLIGFLAGWMAALKYNGLIYLGLLGFILMWSNRKVSSMEALRMIGVFSISAAPGLCWMVWNWTDLGSPVYPMAWSLFGGRGWDETRALSMSQYFDIYGMGRNLLDYLILPWNLALAGRFDTIRFDGAAGPFLIIFLLLAIISAFLLIRRRLVNSMLKNIGVMFVVSAAFFVFGTQQVRFWMPSQMLICIFVAPTVGLLGYFVRGKQMLKVAFILMVIVSLAWNMWFLGNQFLRIGYYKPVFGVEQERAFLVRQVPGYRALEFLNQNLPGHSRVLCVWTGAYGYYIDCSYYSDTFIEDASFKKFVDASSNGKELSQRLRGAGFTHLFFRFSVLVKNMRPQQQAIFVDLLRKGAGEIFSDEDYSVLEIHP